MKTTEKTWTVAKIEALNRRAAEIAGIEWDGHDRFEPEFLDGCHQAAREAGLDFDHYTGGQADALGTSEGPQCEVHRAPDGRLVNLWVDGCLGFDDQIDD
jgi:phosphoribulokinase